MEEHPKFRRRRIDIEDENYVPDPEADKVIPPNRMDLKRGFKVDFAATLRAHRERRGLTLLQLGERAHVSGIKLGWIEEGRGELDWDEIRRVADALLVPLGELFEETMPPKGVDEPGGDE